MPLPVYTEKQANTSKYNNYPFDAASGHAYGEEPLPFHIPEDEAGVCVLIMELMHYWKVHIDSWKRSTEGH